MYSLFIAFLRFNCTAHEFQTYWIWVVLFISHLFYIDAKTYISHQSLITRMSYMYDIILYLLFLKLSEASKLRQIIFSKRPSSFPTKYFMNWLWFTIRQVGNFEDLWTTWSALIFLKWVLIIGQLGRNLNNWMQFSASYYKELRVRWTFHFTKLFQK